MSTLQNLIQLNPQFFEGPVNTILETLKAKHWYQLGEQIIELLSSDGIVGERINFYQEFARFFLRYLMPDHVAEIAFIVSQDYSSPKAAIEFMESIFPLLDKDECSDGKLYLQLQIITQYSIDGNFDLALTMLVKIQPFVYNSADIKIKAKYYNVQATLDKARGDYDEYYEHIMIYLAFSQVKNDLVIAYDICTAALLSKDICSFHEIASHPILDSLVGSDNEWLRNLILLLDKGETTCVDEYKQKYLPIIQSKAMFMKHAQAILFKVTMSVFMQLIFQKPFDSRVFTFKDVAAACSIPIDQVEILVMKGLSSNLISGIIDEVEQIFVITWCKPKQLSIERLQHVKDEIDKWTEIVHEQRILLEQKARDIIG